MNDRLFPVKRNPESEKVITTLDNTDGELKARMLAYGVCRKCAEGAIGMVRNTQRRDNPGANPMGVPVCSEACADGIIAALSAEARH